jgi:hypothetical protein
MRAGACPKEENSEAKAKRGREGVNRIRMANDAEIAMVNWHDRELPRYLQQRPLSGDKRTQFYQIENDARDP